MDDEILFQVHGELARLRHGALNSLSDEAWSSLTTAMERALSGSSKSVIRYGESIPEDYLLVYTGNSDSIQMWDRTLDGAWELTGSLSEGELLARFGVVRTRREVTDEFLAVHAECFPSGPGSLPSVDSEVVGVIEDAAHALRGLLAMGGPLKDFPTEGRQALAAKRAIRRCDEVLISIEND
jgi:hypothetical protein